jgi:hypothetical protein
MKENAYFPICGALYYNFMNTSDVKACEIFLVQIVRCIRPWLKFGDIEMNATGQATQFGNVS